MAKPTRNHQRDVAAPARAPAAHGNAGGLAEAFAWLSLCVLIISLTVFKMSNNDIWIHLKTGETILETWKVPDKDPYSFTASDHDYVAHEWLSGVAFHVVYAAAGVNGLIWFKSGVIFATCLALWGCCRILKVSPLIQWICFTGMLFIGSARYLERPHIFSYLFAALYLLCFTAFRWGGRSRWWLYAIPLLHIVWTNLHGGHYQGIFMLVMLALAEGVIYIRAHWLGLARDAALPTRDVMLIAALPVASMLAALVNPYGYRLLTFPFELTGQELFMKSIYEWQSALFPTYNLSSMFLYYIFWTAALFGSFVLIGNHEELRGGLREGAKAANVALGVLWLIFVAEMASVYKNNESISILARHAPLWYGAVLLFLVANVHRLEFQHAGIVALFFAMSMRHNRAVTDCSVATMPALAHNLQEVAARLRGRGAAPALQRPAIHGVAGAVMLALALFTFRNSYYFGFNPSSTREMGFGVASNMPIGAVDYVGRNGITGNCMPSYNAAAMLLHRTWPGVKVAMDSRNDVYGAELYQEYTAALGGGEALERYLTKWPVDFMLISYSFDRNIAFFKYLDDSPHWTLVYFDDRSVVYLRSIDRFTGIIRRDGYRLISPATAARTEITPDDAPGWLAEADRAVAAAPHAWSPFQYKAKALMVMQRYDEAEAASRQILEMNPGAYFAWIDLGYIAAVRGDRAAAAAAFRNCLALQPGLRVCREALEKVEASR